MAQESPPLKRSKMADNDGETAVLDEDSKRRIIRSHYREIENRISENKDELAKATSKKFLAILNEVDNIHQHVTRPREQVSDAEALLGLVNTFATAVKSSTNGGVTSGEFISCWINQFTKKSRQGVARDATDILWNDIGSFVSPFLREAPRCMTMAGPMDSEVKIRKTYTRVKRTKPVGNARPKEIEKANEAETDTDRNMVVMYNILRKKYKEEVKVQLENLILNRGSFAQTVENLFALSFLVHRGSVNISVEEDGSHVVVPANAPTNALIVNGEAKVHQFIFRFDFQDWKLMKDLVMVGEELMPHRNVNTTSCYSQEKDSAFHGQYKAGSNDDDVNIPQAIPIKSPSNSQAKGAANDENEANAYHGQDKSVSNDENGDIPRAIPSSSPYIPQAVPINSLHHARAKAGSNDEHANVPKATPAKSPYRGGANARSTDDVDNIPKAVLLNSPFSSVVEAFPLRYAFPPQKLSGNHRRVAKSCSKLTDAGKDTMPFIRNGNGKRKRNGQ